MVSVEEYSTFTTAILGSFYVLLLLYLSVYCWKKLENELIPQLLELQALQIAIDPNAPQNKTQISIDTFDKSSDIITSNNSILNDPRVWNPWEEFETDDFYDPYNPHLAFVHNILKNKKSSMRFRQNIEYEYSDSTESDNNNKNTKNKVRFNFDNEIEENKNINKSDNKNKNNKKKKLRSSTYDKFRRNNTFMRPPPSIFAPSTIFKSKTSIDPKLLQQTTKLRNLRTHESALRLKSMENEYNEYNQKDELDIEETIRNEVSKKDSVELSCGAKFGYWLWVSWNMSSIYGLLMIHIWDISTDIAVIVKFYGIGSRDNWHSWHRHKVNILGLLIGSIMSLVLYRIVSGYLVYKLTNSKFRFFLQLFDLEIYRTVFISFKLKLSEPGYIQTWIQKLEAALESLPQRFDI